MGSGIQSGRERPHLFGILMNLTLKVG